MMKWRVLFPLVVLLTNVLVAALVYETVGWYFLRGYNEVVNFLIYPAVLIHGGLNVLLAGILFFVAWLCRRAFHRRLSWVNPVLAGLLLSAVLVVISPWFAPVIGEIAKMNLWIETPLIEAARYGDAELVIVLLNGGADPNARCVGLGTTPLHYMAASGEKEAVKLLLEEGADPNARAATSLETPLHWAVDGRADLSVIRTLVEFGADPKLKDWEGRTPIDYTYVIPDPEGEKILAVFGRCRIRE